MVPSPPPFDTILTRRVFWRILSGFLNPRPQHFTRIGCEELLQSRLRGLMDVLFSRGWQGEVLSRFSRPYGVVKGKTRDRGMWIRSVRRCYLIRGSLGVSKQQGMDENENAALNFSKTYFGTKKNRRFLTTYHPLPILYR